MSSTSPRSAFQRILLLLLMIPIAGCQEEKPPERAWVDLRLKADELARGGEIDRALIVVGNAIEMADSDPATHPIEMVWLLDDLVLYLEKADRDAETLPHRERALAELIEAVGPDAAKLFPRHDQLASRQMLIPDYVKSGAHFRRAIALAEAHAGSDAPVLVDLLSRYADCLMTQRKNSEAEPLLLRARGIADSHPGTGLEEFPDTLLAALHQSLGRDDQAEEVLLRQVTQAEQDPTKPAVLEYRIGELARFYQEHDRAGEAAPLYQRLIDLKQPRLGPDHPDIKALLAKMEETSPPPSSSEPVVPPKGPAGLEEAGSPVSSIDPIPFPTVPSESPGEPASVPGEPSPLPPIFPGFKAASPPNPPSESSPPPSLPEMEAPSPPESQAPPKLPGIVFPEN